MMPLARPTRGAVRQPAKLCGTASAECACLPPLRTFTPEERQQFETSVRRQLVEGDGTSSRSADPGRLGGAPPSLCSARKQFWDPRACASNTIDRRGPKSK
jgi:hypothetical protein